MQVFDNRTGAKVFKGNIVRVIKNDDSNTVSIDCSAGYRAVLATEEIALLKEMFVSGEYDEYH